MTATSPAISLSINPELTGDYEVIVGDRLRDTLESELCLALENRATGEVMSMIPQATHVTRTEAVARVLQHWVPRTRPLTASPQGRLRRGCDSRSPPMRAAETGRTPPAQGRSRIVV